MEKSKPQPEAKKKLKSVEQTHDDRDQHYEMDGVSLSREKEKVIVGSEAIETTQEKEGA
jgi:hypothetical protein